jgi:anion-transporting  ArsA/GET3 family ATPase
MAHIKRINEMEDMVGYNGGYIKDKKYTPEERSVVLNSIIKELQNAPDSLISEISVMLSVKKTVNNIKEPVEKFIAELDELGEESWNALTDSSRYRFILYNAPGIANLPDAKRFIRSLSKISFEDVKQNIYSIVDLKSELN